MRFRSYAQKIPGKKFRAKTFGKKFAGKKFPGTLFYLGTFFSRPFFRRKARSIFVLFCALFIYLFSQQKKTRKCPQKTLSFLSKIKLKNEKFPKSKENRKKFKI